MFESRGFGQEASCFGLKRLYVCVFWYRNAEQMPPTTTREPRNAREDNQESLGAASSSGNKEAYFFPGTGVRSCGRLNSENGLVSIEVEEVSSTRRQTFFTLVATVLSSWFRLEVAWFCLNEGNIGR